jgi:hypothetical protein
MPGECRNDAPQRRRFLPGPVQIFEERNVDLVEDLVARPS